MRERMRKRQNVFYRNPCTMICNDVIDRKVYIYTFMMCQICTTFHIANVYREKTTLMLIHHWLRGCFRFIA